MPGTDDYDDVEVKPNQATVVLGMILSVVAVFVGGIMQSNASTTAAAGIGQAVMIGGMVGFFLMTATIAIISAIYKRS